METPSAPDTRRREPIGPELQQLLNPVEASEVRRTLEDGHESVPGTDGIKLSDLKHSEDLTTHFNLWLLTATPPSEFKGVMMLVPKSKDVKLFCDYRLITVCTMISRVSHRLLASRLECELPLSPRQKAFRHGDGLTDNIWLLRSKYKSKLERAKPPHMRFIDVVKAFDSVSQETIIAAARRMGVPERLHDYFSQLFIDSITSLKLNNGMSAPIRIGRGVKQSEPLSAILFNCVMNWILSELDENVGVSIKPSIRVNHLAFANDVVLMAESVAGLNRLVDNYEERVSMAGLKQNPRKSATISIVVDGKRKKAVIGTKCIVKLDGQEVPALDSSMVYRYIGI